MRFPFIGPAYSSSSPRADAQECINLYPEAIESGQGANTAALYTVPGMSAWGTIPTTPIRGLWGGDGRLFAVGGSKLYEVSSGGSATLRGDVGNDNLPVDMSPNGNMLMVVSAGNVYIDTGTSIIQPHFIDDPGTAVTAGSGAYLDGYFVIAEPNSTKVRISGLRGSNVLPDDSPTYDWDPLDFEYKAATPDNVNRVFADHEEIWLFGFESTEVWRNVGDPDFPFQRDPGAMIHVGLMARNSPVSIASGIAFVGGDERGGPQAFLCQGYTPKRISNHAIEQQWEKYSTVQDAVAYSYVEGGHSFWVVNFPTGNATWVWDATTGEWHRRGYWNGSGWDRQRGTHHAFEFGKHILADWQTGALYQASVSINTEMGAAIHWRRTAPHIADELGRYPHNKFRVNYDGTATMTLAYADDSKNFCAERNPSGPVIAKGDPSKVIGQEWRRLGSSKDRMYRLTGTGRVSLIDAYVNSKD